MFSFCVKTGSIKYNDELVARLGHSETALLYKLALSTGELVAKNILLDVGWPGKVVAPNSLSAAIKNIRKAIRALNCGIYIETVHRRGYVFHNPDCIPVFINNEENNNEKTELSGLDSLKRKDDHEQHDDAINAPVTLHFDNNKAQVWSNRFIGIIKSRYGGYIIGKLKSISFYSYVLFVCFLSYMVFLSRAEMSCFSISDARVCGVFELPRYKKAKVITLVGERKGDFYYGYNNKLDHIEVYQAD